MQNVLFKDTQKMKKVLKVSAAALVSALMMSAGGCALAMKRSSVTREHTKSNGVMDKFDGVERSSDQPACKVQKLDPTETDGDTEEKGETTEEKMEDRGPEVQCERTEERKDMLDFEVQMSVANLVRPDSNGVLDLHCKKLPAEIWAEFFKQLRSNDTTTDLDLGFCHLGYFDLSGLAEALEANSTLRKLNLYSNYLEDDKIFVIKALTKNISLKEICLGGNGLGDVGIGFIAEVLQHNSTLEVLDLTYTQLKDAGKAYLANMLRINSSLKDLILKDCALSRNTAVFFEALGVNHSLQSLDLFRCSIVDKGVSQLAEALKVNCTLTSLNLSNNHIEDKGACALAGALRVNSTLTSLNLYENSIGDKGACVLADAVKVNSTLLSLNLFYNKIDDTGALSLAEALRVNSTLKDFDWSQDRLENSVAIELMIAFVKNHDVEKLELTRKSISVDTIEALKESSTLTSLELPLTTLQDEDVAVELEKMLNESTILMNLRMNNDGLSSVLMNFATNTVAFNGFNTVCPEGQVPFWKNVLTNNTSLTSLDLRYCSIEMSSLAQGLKNNCSITDLNLGGSRSVNDEGFKHLSEALPTNQALGTINVCCCNIGAEGIRDFAEALLTNSVLVSINLAKNKIGDEGAKCLEKGLKVNISLTELDLRENEIGDEGAKCFAEVLKLNSALTYLNLDSNSIERAGVRSIIGALKNNSSLTSLVLGKCKGIGKKNNLADELASNITLTDLRLEY